MCRRQWEDAVANFPEGVLNKSRDPYSKYRGDECLNPGPTAPKLLFVHAGKTGGTAVGTVLFKNEELIEENQWTEVNMHPVRPSVTQHIGYCNHILISVRDPIDRFISAFNTEVCFNDTSIGENEVARIEICRKRKYLSDGLNREGKYKLRTTGHGAGHPAVEPAGDTNWKSCNFTSLGAFADVLEDDAPCGALARDMLRTPAPNVPGGTRNHLARGLCFYVGGMLDALRAENRTVLLVRAENSQADIAAITKWLGLPGPWMPDKKHLWPSDHSNIPHHDDTMSAEGREKLRRQLAPEYALYEELLASFSTDDVDESGSGSARERAAF